MPVVSGNRAIFSGSVPATQAAVTWHSAAAQPLVTSPHSHCINSPMRVPTASISSSRWTYCLEASTMACRTAGKISEPLMMV